MESTPVSVINDYEKGGLMMTESMKARPALVVFPSLIASQHSNFKVNIFWTVNGAASSLDSEFAIACLN